MSKLRVVVRGLFAVVRHTDPPQAAKQPEPEPMTLVFPRDDHGGAGGHSSHAGGHRTIMFISDRALAIGGNPPRGVRPAKIPESESLKGYTPFELKDWEIHLPLEDGMAQHPVGRAHDIEVASSSEPIDCDVIKHRDVFKSLTMLPNLNVLTESKFDARHLNTPPHARKGKPPLVQTRVRLSGGMLHGIKSYKALRSGFFEFFDKEGTVLIQPAIEDVEFTVTTPDAGVTVGFTRLAGGRTTPYTLPVLDNPTLLFQSLPSEPVDAPTGSDIRPNLNHFAFYYPLMASTKGLRTPAVRVLARCKEARQGARLVHTMPAMNDIETPTFPIPPSGDAVPRGRTTPGTCSCLVAMAFSPDRGRATSGTGRSTTSTKAGKRPPHRR